MILQSLVDQLVDFDRSMSPERIKRDHYDVENRDSNNLLVCLGESWTKGIGLNDRHQEVFGSQISQSLGWDWINAGGDGLSNSWALNHFEFLVPWLNGSKYESGAVVVVFTENGREVADYSSRKFDYINAYSHIDVSVLYDKVLDDIEDEWIQRLDSIRKRLDPRFQIIVGYDMVTHDRLHDRYSDDHSIQLIQPRWLDLLADSMPKPRSNHCRLTCVSNLDIVNDLLKIKNRDFYKSWFLQQTDLALETITWMCDTPEYFESDDRGHPNAKGHRLWADLILQSIAHF